MSDIVKHLVEIADACRRPNGDDIPLGEQLRTAADTIETLNAKLETASALVTCCCGSPVDTHGTGDGHSPVDMYHYHLMQIEKQNDRLKSLLCLADEALMLSHGCFPLDRVTDYQRYLNDAAKAIRAVTGADFDERKRLAAVALTGAE